MCPVATATASGEARPTCGREATRLPTGSWWPGAVGAREAPAPRAPAVSAAPVALAADVGVDRAELARARLPEAAGPAASSTLVAMVALAALAAAAAPTERSASAARAGAVPAFAARLEVAGEAATSAVVAEAEAVSRPAPIWGAGGGGGGGSAFAETSATHVKMFAGTNDGNGSILILW